MSEHDPTPIVPSVRPARVAQAIALAIIVVVPSLYSFRFMSFMDSKWAGLAVGLALLAIAAPPKRAAPFARFRLLGPISGILVSGFLMVLFSGDASSLDVASTAFWYGILIVLAASLLQRNASTLSVLGAIAFSSVPVSLLALPQYARLLPAMFPDFPDYGQRMYSVFGNQDLLGGYVALGLVLAFALWLEGRLSHPLAFMIFAAAGPTLLLSGSRSAWLAAMLGVGVAVAQGRVGRKKIALFLGASFGMIALCVAIAPDATWGRLINTFAAGDTGFRIRLWIWDGTLRLISQHPLGVGLGNFAYHSPRALGEVLHDRGPGVHVFNHIHTQHAHSDILEIVAETGVVGLILLLLFLINIPRRPSAAWPALAAAFTFSSINTTLHSPPHVLAVLLLAISITDDPAPQLSDSSGQWWGRVAQAAFYIWMAIACTVYPLRASAAHAKARAFYEAGDSRAREAYEEASISNPAARLELATIHANEGREWEAVAESHFAAYGLDTGELYYLQAYLAERLAQPESAKFYRECLVRWPDHTPAYAGLLRTSPAAERDAILREAQRWVSPTGYATLTETPSQRPAATPVQP